ncbi:carbon-nitrogen hydrolase family protein [Acidithiobacillus ferrooxidans]|uniref:carbon-nitrogen hydrolase family protein n=1 Tax=Acidithiobacillus ferrooxidans TaxID=920 RepID=UPI001C06F977|nr:carbon-nitrogen hydrolase family protein [Acidithiobacillus ferrooxidans]MBU2856304.1 carbon-nitrogen hydrolase family protein [Acidithiobacillus ferrooxidans]MBU2862204.1 carbon-nitrogen hydrolase family protein [Acidithiobacillus ferrooxidans]
MSDAGQFRVGIYQSSTEDANVPARLNKLKDGVLSAVGRGVDLLVFPEMYLTGYAIGLEAVKTLAEFANGASMQVIAACARVAKMTIVYGYPERDQAGFVYNSINVISSSGELLQTYRKVMLFGNVDRTQFSPGQGYCLPIMLHGFRIGFGICYDVEFPEVARALALAGAEMLVVPTANMRPFESVSDRLIPARAQENGIFVVYANYFGHDEMFDYFGKSVICDPFGNDVIRAETGEHLLVADIHHDTVRSARVLNDYLNDYRHAAIHIRVMEA